MAIDLKNTYKAKSHTAEKYSVQILERKAVEVKEWMDAKHLKMNNNKTEFITFASKQMLKLCTTDNLKVNDVSVPRCEVIKYLGAWLDQHLQLIKHITVKCGIAVANLQRIKLVRPFLTSIYAPQCWNALPDGLRNIDKIQTFKSKLKTHFYQQYLL